MIRPHPIAPALALTALLAACGAPPDEGGDGGEAAADEGSTADRTIRTRVQVRPGGPVEEVEMGVHEVPVDPPSVSADEADLDDDELVLGLVLDGRPIAYPIRYLATTEVVNHRVGDTPLAPSW